MLIALRMTGPRDVAAIDEWVRLHADEDTAREVKASLPALPVGTGWIWSPGWLEILQRVQIRTRRTFDSSATPKAGQQRATAERMADVDLAALAELLATDLAPGEGARDDSAALHRQIAVLERQLAEASAAPREVVREVPVLTEDDRMALQALVERADRVAAEARELRDAVLGRRPADAAPTAAPRSSLAPSPPTTATARDVPRPESRGGTFGTYFSMLRRAGLLEENTGLVSATSTGLAAAEVEPGRPLTVEEVREQWRSVLRAGARAMLDHLIEAYPASVSRDELAAATNITVSGGTFGTYLSQLRRNGLASVAGEQVRADAVLFTA